MNFKVTHITHYLYSEPVGTCHNEARLIPCNTRNQICHSSQINVSPLTSDYRERTDFFGNRVTYFAINTSHTELKVTAVSSVETQSNSIDDTMLQQLPAWEEVVTQVSEAKDNGTLNAQQFCYNSPMIIATPDMSEYARPSFSKNRPVTDAINDLVERIHRDFTYDPQFTTIATPLQDVLKHRRGVCQDFAQVAIACLRSLGLPARYVSGYLETIPPAGQQRLVGADASHAWFSVYIPNLGWVDYDPTNNLMPMDQHITVAIGRDYQDVTPLKGVIFGGGEHELSVSVDVQRVEDSVPA